MIAHFIEIQTYVTLEPTVVSCGVEGSEGEQVAGQGVGQGVGQGACQGAEQGGVAGPGGQEL
jgi:hypothetical protein